MFTVGSIGLVLWMLVSRLDSQSLPEEAGNLVLVFFAAAMLGLAFSSLETDALSVTGQEQQKHRLNRYWLGSVLTIIASLLGLGLLLSLLLVPETVARLSSWAWNVLSVVLIFLIKLISLILYPLLYLLALILPPILKGILARYRIGWLSEPEALPERSDPSDPFGALYKAVEGLPDELSWVGLVILILGIGLVFMLALRYLLSEIDETGVEERRDFIFSKELLLAQLSLWWPQWLSRLRRISYLANDPYLSVADELSPRRAIREIYQKMLAAARERGQPRLRNQTPVEYGHELGQSLPGVEAELEVITMRYMQARYDSELPTQEQVLETRQAWKQLEARLRE
jgi:MFS family permease